MIIAGIDEAGRGCCLGPMVVACLWLDHGTVPLLRELGVRDSKRVAPVRRTVLFQTLAERGFRFAARFAFPEEIDRENLNRLHFRKTAELIAEADADVTFVDAPVPPRGLPKYRRELFQATGRKVYPLNRADERIPVVAAASIVAKVVRDQMTAYLKATVGDFGSGYPSDPRTAAWLAVHRDAAVVRKLLRTKWNLKTA
jgi:ribonuclease HII